MRFVSALMLLAASSPIVLAQRGGHVSGAVHGQRSGLALNQGAHRGSGSGSPYTSLYGSRHGAPYSALSLPFPFFGDALDSGDIYSTGYPVAAQPPAFLMQAARDMAGPSADAMGSPMSRLAKGGSTAAQPLMIELQGGRYVRVSNAAIDGEALPLNLSSGAESSGKSVAPAERGAIAAKQNLPATLLIFRDGRREEVGDYTIADGILYAHGDFYRDGYWNKKIELAALDLSETLHVNASRNVKFVVPSAPNEVIARF
jgi:hypothetical protein